MADLKKGNICKALELVTAVALVVLEVAAC